ncbi:hypothetical protein F4777DRAFT_315037 [Nemania sp. FL0916]|nr:hypothetical protein F4777DRAFT_315037 [Nemania sp. FL0916]
MIDPTTRKRQARTRARARAGARTRAGAGAGQGFAGIAGVAVCQARSGCPCPCPEPSRCDRFERLYSTYLHIHTVLRYYGISFLMHRARPALDMLVVASSVTPSIAVVWAALPQPPLAPSSPVTSSSPSLLPLKLGVSRIVPPRAVVQRILPKRHSAETRSALLTTRSALPIASIRSAGHFLMCPRLLHGAE